MRAFSFAIFIVAFGLAVDARADVSRTKHNLSAGGGGTIRATGETRVCDFCHIPHSAKGPRALWGRPINRGNYTPYESTTRKTQPQQPDGASRLCLSCHDGTLAVGLLHNKSNVPMQGVGVGGVIPPGRTNLGTDLRGSHPVSMRFPSNTGALHAPMGRGVRLDHQGKMQCTSCHDPHKDDIDPLMGKFLVKSNAYSELCLTCHTPRLWHAGPSAHQASTARFPAQDGNHTPYSTVAEAGCESCHRPHSTGPSPRLLKSPEEVGCLNCHNGRVAQSNVLNDLQKTYSHPVLDARPSVHDAAEGAANARNPLPESSPGALRHAECVDCHNPHAARAQAASAPDVSGALLDVWGIDRFGQKVEPAQFEYEICFKCHGDSANKPQAKGFGGAPVVQRQIPEFNLREMFDPNGPSAHPVVAPGRNPSVPGLIQPLNEGSQIYCTDCHGSDNGNGAPHGSIYPYLLERNYSTAAGSVESSATYALCYKCHDRNTLLSDNSNFDLHRKHVVEESTSCAACHTPHGISAEKGDLTANAHLINFNTQVVKPNSRGLLRYTSYGIGSGTCELNCHGADHRNESYP